MYYVSTVIGKEVQATSTNKTCKYFIFKINKIKNTNYVEYRMIRVTHRQWNL
jgi:hypothetical protein